jgi:hypothetical protein
MRSRPRELPFRLSLSDAAEIDPTLRGRLRTDLALLSVLAIECGASGLSTGEGVDSTCERGAPATYAGSPRTQCSIEFSANTSSPSSRRRDRAVQPVRRRRGAARLRRTGAPQVPLLRRAYARLRAISLRRMWARARARSWLPSRLSLGMDHHGDPSLISFGHPGEPRAVLLDTVEQVTLSLIDEHKMVRAMLGVDAPGPARGPQLVTFYQKGDLQWHVS